MKNEITQKIGRRMADIRKSKQLTQDVNFLKNVP